MSEIRVVAIITAKPEHADEVQATLASFASSVESSEPQTLQYELLSSPKKGEFIVVETYADKATLATHGKTNHFTAAMEKIGPWLAGPPDIKIAKKVGGYGLRSKL